MSLCNNDQDDKFNSRWLSDKLKDYRIERDIVELYKVIFSNSLINVHLRDLISALSESRINYIRIGY